MTLPNLKGAKPNRKSLFKQTTKEEFKQTIYNLHGIITLICSVYDVNYHQFWTAVKRWNLEEDVKRAKEMLISDAEAALFNALSSKTEQNRLRAADCIMRHCAPHTPTQEITVKTDDKEIQIRQLFGISD